MMVVRDPVKQREYQRLYRMRHRERVRANARKWRLANLDKAREASRLCTRRRYGVLNPTNESKRGECQICHKICDLKFDHDHKTGIHRGWLCNGCNPKLDWHIKYFLAIQKYLQSKVGEGS